MNVKTKFANVDAKLLSLAKRIGESHVIGQAAGYRYKQRRYRSLLTGQARKAIREAYPLHVTEIEQEFSQEITKARNAFLIANKDYLAFASS